MTVKIGAAVLRADVRLVHAGRRSVAPHGDEDPGHSQIGLTMNTYTHVLPEIEREAIDAVARTIFE